MKKRILAVFVLFFSWILSIFGTLVCTACWFDQNVHTIFKISNSLGVLGWILVSFYITSKLEKEVRSEMNVTDPVGEETEADEY